MRVVQYVLCIVQQHENCPHDFNVLIHLHERIQRGAGDPYPIERKIKGFLSNTGPDPLKNHKSTKPAFNFGSSMLGHHWPASERNAI